jgi:hypothetical protein
MSFKVKKIVADENNKGYAISSDVSDDGSLFELASGNLMVSNSTNGGIGLFDLDVNALNNYQPSNSTRVDVYFELDGNGDIRPKA